MFRRKTDPPQKPQRRPSIHHRDSGSCRRHSEPCVPVKRLRGIMKYVSADESIHSSYGVSGERKGPEPANSDSDESRRSIEFKDIIIREYARTIGDNPSCSSGPPISISWEYVPVDKVLPVEEYESTRMPRRSHFEMVIPRNVRQEMLRKEWDVAQSQIAAAVRANIKIKNQRRATVNNIGKATKMEEILESAGRKLKRGLLMKKSVSKEVELLQKQLQQVECMRKQLQLERHMEDEFNEGKTEDDTMFEEEPPRIDI